MGNKEWVGNQQCTDEFKVEAVRALEPSNDGYR